MAEKNFTQEGPPVIDLGIIQEGEKKRAEETRREAEAFLERPIQVPVGSETVSVKPFTFDKMMVFQDLYWSVVQKSQNFGKANPVSETTDIGELIVQMGAMRKEIHEAALLIACLVLEPTSEDKDIDLKNLAYSPEKIRRKITPGQLSFIISKGQELCQTDSIQKKILGVSG